MQRRRNLKRPAAVFLSMTVAASLFSSTAMTAFADDAAESEASSVRVVVINNTDTSEDLNSSLQGTFVDMQVTVDADTTALEAVTDALNENGYTLDSYTSDYGTYLTSVSVTGSEGAGDTLAESYSYYTENDVNYSAGSYWSIWLNGQYCGYGIDYYTMADSTLADGDTFILDYTGYLYNADTGEAVGESTSGLVDVVVQNTTDTETDLQGTIIDKWVEVTSSSTALVALKEALGEDGYTLGYYESSYGTYLESISLTNSEGETDTLAGYSDYYEIDKTAYSVGAYWAIYLNDEYCSYGIDYYTIADGTLAAGDKFTMNYESYEYSYGLEYAEDPEEDADDGQTVHIVVTNNIYSDDSLNSALQGTIVDEWVSVDETTTALEALTLALENNGYTLGYSNSDYGTYLEAVSISGSEAEGDSLAGYSNYYEENSMAYSVGAYWAIYLNDEYCSYGIDYYTMADETLSDGDTFTMSYETYSYSYELEDNQQDADTNDQQDTDTNSQQDTDTNNNQQTIGDGTTDGNSDTEPVKQSITVKKASLKKTFKAAKLAKGKKTFKIKAAAKTKVTFTKKNTKYIKVSKNGTVTVKKGTPAGTYKVKVKVKAAKTKKYQKASVTKTIVVKVK